MPRSQGSRADDIDRADFILVGHSHFDHLWGAERIAPRTGATIIGSYESIRIMAAHGVPEAQLLPVSGGERIQLRPDVFVTVYPSLHSCVWTGPFQQPDVVCLGDLGVPLHEQKQRFAAIATSLSNLDPAGRAHYAAGNQGARGDGGALVFLIETPEGSLLYQDTCGHWSGIMRDLRPDVAILAAAGRGNVDGDPVQGTMAQFIAREALFLQPRRVLLGHHDDWLPGFTFQTDVAPIRAALATAVPRTDLVEIGYRSGYELFAP